MGQSTGGQSLEGANASPLTWRALLLACALTALFGLWVRQAEVVILATQITESVPAIPAIAALALLMVLNPLLARLGVRRRPRAQISRGSASAPQGWRLSRVELLSVYCFVAIAISLAGCGIVRFQLALLGYPFYFAQPQNKLGAIQQYLPGWLVPKQPGVMQQMYEGAPDGRVPWGAWAVPLLAWSGFFLLMWVGMLCMMVLVRRRWSEDERLTYPIAQLPLDIMQVREPPPGQPPFLRDWVMWAGFAVAFAYNASNIAGTFLPSFPAVGTYFSLAQFAGRRPWNELLRFPIWFRPELVGFGFLVPAEIAFSIWFFFALSRLEELLLLTGGFEVSGVPFEMEQSMGAFVLLGVLLIWGVRKHLSGAARDLFVRRPPPEPEEIMPRRWALLGVIVTFIALCVFCRVAGMRPWLAVAYLGIVMLVALVSARMRAETGIPLIWLFPFYQQKKLLLYLLGPAAFLSGTLPGTLTMFALLAFLSRGYFPALIGYQAESLKIGHRAGIKPRHMAILIILALLVGLAVAYYVHLTPYYRHGAQYLPIEEIWGTPIAAEEYGAASKGSLAARDPYRIAATVWGLLLAGLLAHGRRAFLGFPFHPVGFAAATAFGEVLAAPFFLVWLVKVCVLRYGGLRLYRRTIPFFLGLALGHFFTAGIIWGLVGAYGGERARSYTVYFG